MEGNHRIAICIVELSMNIRVLFRHQGRYHNPRNPMDTLSAPLAPHSKLGDTITTLDLTTILENFPTIKILSLDCFDTILWRKTSTAIDVFYHLQDRPHFQTLGFTAL